MKRLYVPMPCEEARREIVERLIKQQHHNLTDDDLCSIAAKSDGMYVGSLYKQCTDSGPVCLYLCFIRIFGCGCGEPL